MDATLERLFDRHGLFLRRDFLAAGGAPKTLTRMVRSGDVRRVRHGAYTAPHQWNSLDEVGRHVLTARAVLRSARCEAALSHATALAIFGGPLWDLPMGTVHVSRTDGRAGRREAGVAQHTTVLQPEEIFELDTTPTTSPTRTGIDLASTTDLEHTLVVLDWLLHNGLTTKDQLRECYDSHVFARGSLHTELAITLADPRAESVGESRSRYLFWSSGLPAPLSQVDVFDETGRLIGRVDFAWPDLGVFLEFDGRVKYADLLAPGQDTVDVVLAEKRREERICRATGWRCVRLTWADLGTPTRTAAYLRSVLDGGTVH